MTNFVESPIRPSAPSLKKKPTLKSLFPNGDESYLAVIIKLGENVVLRMLLTNDRLTEEKEIWKYAQEVLAPTDLNVNFMNVKKDVFRLENALDRFNGGDGESITECISSKKQFIDTLGGFIDFYNDFVNSMNPEDKENIPSQDDLDFPIEAPTENSAIGTFTPATDKEIEFMYQ